MIIYSLWFYEVDACHVTDFVAAFREGDIFYERLRRLDGGAHRHKFDRIKQRYAVGSQAASRMLTPAEINRLAPTFLESLGSILGIKGHRAIDIISRKGRILTAQQVRDLLEWLDSRDR